MYLEINYNYRDYMRLHISGILTSAGSIQPLSTSGYSRHPGMCHHRLIHRYSLEISVLARHASHCRRSSLIKSIRTDHRIGPQNHSISDSHRPLSRQHISDFDALQEGTANEESALSLMCPKGRPAALELHTCGGILPAANAKYKTNCAA
jgi:hypothetical protein